MLVKHSATMPQSQPTVHSDRNKIFFVRYIFTYYNRYVYIEDISNPRQILSGYSASNIFAPLCVTRVLLGLHGNWVDAITPNHQRSRTSLILSYLPKPDPLYISTTDKNCKDIFYTCVAQQMYKDIAVLCSLYGISCNIFKQQELSIFLIYFFMLIKYFVYKFDFTLLCPHKDLNIITFFQDEEIVLTWFIMMYKCQIRIQDVICGFVTFRRKLHSYIVTSNF